MTADSFRYSDEQWQRMEAIVERAGKAVARNKFNAQRAAFENTAGGWKDRRERWSGRTLSDADAFAYARLEQAARELNAVFDQLSATGRLPFPAILVGCDLVWKGLAETRENDERFAAFRKALDHIAKRAAQVTRPERRRPLLARNRFFGELGRVWRVELGLEIKASATSRFVKFVATASEEVCDFPGETPLDTISNVIRKWPRRAAV
jgi:hypothetical protein